MADPEVDKLRAELDKLRGEVTRLTEGIGDSPFPLWVDSIDVPNYAPATATATVTSGQGDPLRFALGEVLGWRFNPADPKGFVTALTQAFPLVKDESGHLTPKWTPRSYTVQTIEAGVGAITGAQASIYTRAKAILDQVLPLLDGLQPLDDNADVQDTAAISALIREELVELVNLLGAEGGPPPQRIDLLLKLLLAYDPARQDYTLSDPEKVGGQLGRLRDLYGLTGRSVNTIAEEMRLTNFFIIVNYVDTLLLSWHAQRTFFDRQGDDVFFGTQLVLIARALGCVAESVGEVRMALESVLIGAREQETLRLNTHPPMTVAELLTWIDEVASRKGLELIQSGGKDGVIFAFAPIVKQLARLAEEAVRGHQRKLPQAFRSRRVQRAWSELIEQLKTTAQLAGQIQRTPAPTISTVVPNTARQGAADVSVTIDGADFQSGATVKLAPSAALRKALGHTPDPLDSESVTHVSETQLDAVFDIPSDAPTGQWNMVVTNPDGRAGRAPFTITPSGGEVQPPPPQLTISKVEPAEAQQGHGQSSPVAVRISGSGFSQAKTKLIHVEGVEAKLGQVEAGSLQATFTILAGATPGLKDVYVTNEEGGRLTTAQLPRGFEIKAAPAGNTPVVRQVEPPAIEHQKHKDHVPVQLVISGEDFAPNAKVALEHARTGLTLYGKVLKSSAREIEAEFDHVCSAPDGDWRVRVINVGTRTSDALEFFRMTHK
jgi:hypothetical protein